MKGVRFILYALAMLCIIPVLSCSKNDCSKEYRIAVKPDTAYGDISQFLTQTDIIQSQFICYLIKSTGPDDVALAINIYAHDMEALSKTARELEKKYPRFNAENPPEELRDDYEKLRNTADALARASIRVMEYALDPEVSRALKGLEKGKVDTMLFPDR